MKKFLLFFLLGVIVVMLGVAFVFLQKGSLQKSVEKKIGPDKKDRISYSCDEGYMYSEKDCECVTDLHGCRGLDKEACEKNPNCYSFSRGGTCSCPACEIWLEHQCLPRED
ncbi:hypothetical protein ACFLZ1_00230 [Patescibacteria group bacterium]